MMLNKNSTQVTEYNSGGSFDVIMEAYVCADIYDIIGQYNRVTLWKRFSSALLSLWRNVALATSREAN